MPQTLWLRELFTFYVEVSLTFRNVRISGQKLIQEDCEEEWCTHCLVAPYLWSASDKTVIEKHSAVDVTDPYYDDFQCTHSPFNFFEVIDSVLTIENSTFDNIRIRAGRFISLLGTANLTLTQSTISRMDFTEGFIGGSCAEVQLSGLFVTGFNRDHAYVRNYPGDSGLVQLNGVSRFTLVSSLFEDNLQLLDMNAPGYATVDVGSYVDVVISNCTFRRTMSGVWLWNGGQTVLIFQCVFQGNFVTSSSFLHIDASTPVHIVITECSFAHNTASYFIFMHFYLNAGSSVQLSHSEFLNNRSYQPASMSSKDCLFIYAYVMSNFTLSHCQFTETENYSSNLFAQLVTAQLINHSPEVDTDFLQFPQQNYRSVLEFQSWSEVRIVNVTVTVQKSMNYEYGLFFSVALPNSVLTIDSLTVRNVWKLCSILHTFRTACSRT